jgi:hypothetical protein
LKKKLLLFFCFKEENAHKLEIKDLSDFMNTTMTWYLICNLPTPYLKSLEIENASLVEKLRNGMVYRYFLLG